MEKVKKFTEKLVWELSQHYSDKVRIKKLFEIGK